MKKFAILLTVVLLVGCQSQPGTKPVTKLDTAVDSMSYALGLDMGHSFGIQEIELNTDALVQGIKDAMGEGEQLLSDEDGQMVMRNFQTDLRKKQRAKREAEGEMNKEEGEKFLAENKEREGVITTSTGLQYEVIREGTGRIPRESNEVKVHYKGTLLNGKVFDSSYERGEPAEFPVSGVITGWTEALTMMKEGAKWKLYIPENLAYGSMGAGPDIGPYATLIFEVELIEIKL